MINAPNGENREPYRNGSLIMLGRDELQPRSLCVWVCVFGWIASMPKSNKFNKSFRAGVHALLQWILDAPFHRASIAAGEQTLWQFDFWSAVSTAAQHKQTHT